MQPLSAQEAFWNWAIQLVVIVAGSLFAVCLATIIAVFASNRDNERPHDD